jgi:hypothetical protein
MNITNGTIGYSRVKKDEDFGINRRGEASLSFTFNDDETFDTSKIEQAVFDIAHRLLTKQFTAARAAELKAEPEAGVKLDAVSPPVPATPTGSAPVVNDKERLALEAKTVAQFGQGPKPPRAPRKTKDAPAPEATTKAAVVSDNDVILDDDPLGLGIIVPEVKPEPVTDAELGSATVAQNKKIQKPDAIRALIAEFAGAPPKQARDIPQDKRHAYLEKLKTLT